MAITSLSSCNSIATEFGVPLPTAARMNWYYDNKNPASPVQPVMGGGRITDWIGYDHSYKPAPVKPPIPSMFNFQIRYQRNSSANGYLRFFLTLPDIDNDAWMQYWNSINYSIPFLKIGGLENIVNYPYVRFTNGAGYNYIFSEMNSNKVYDITNTEYVRKVTGFNHAIQFDAKPVSYVAGELRIFEQFIDKLLTGIPAVTTYSNKAYFSETSSSYKIENVRCYFKKYPMKCDIEYDSLLDLR